MLYLRYTTSIMIPRTYNILQKAGLENVFCWLVNTRYWRKFLGWAISSQEHNSFYNLLTGIVYLDYLHCK